MHGNKKENIVHHVHKTMKRNDLAEIIVFCLALTNALLRISQP